MDLHASLFQLNGQKVEKLNLMMMDLGNWKAHEKRSGYFTNKLD